MSYNKKVHQPVPFGECSTIQLFLEQNFHSLVKTVPKVRETVKELTNIVRIEVIFMVPSKK